MPQRTHFLCMTISKPYVKGGPAFPALAPPTHLPVDRSGPHPSLLPLLVKSVYVAYLGGVVGDGLVAKSSDCL